MRTQCRIFGAGQVHHVGKTAIGESDVPHDTNAPAAIWKTVSLSLENTLPNPVPDDAPYFCNEADALGCVHRRRSRRSRTSVTNPLLSDFRAPPMTAKNIRRQTNGDSIGLLEG